MTLQARIQRPRSHRLDWVDTVRIGLTALVLAHHAAITYGHFPVWYFHEEPTDASATLLDLFAVANQSFIMGLFFLISGYFVPAALNRKGPRKFARDRLIRLGAPLLAYVVLIRPLAGLHAWVEKSDSTPYPLYYVTTIDAGPAWFLEVLLLFSLACAVTAAMRGSRGRQAATASNSSSASAPISTPSVAPSPSAPLSVGPTAVVFLVLILVMSSALLLWRQIVPDGSYWPIVGLPTPSYLPQYALMFCMGVLAAQHRWLERIPRSAGFVGGGLSLIATVTIGPSALSVSTIGSDLAAAVMTSVLGVGLSITVLLLARELAPTPGPVHHWLSTNTFAVYFIHPAVLVGLALVLHPLSAPAIVKFAILLIVGAAICWLVASQLRRIPGVSRVL